MDERHYGDVEENDDTGEAPAVQNEEESQDNNEETTDNSGENSPSDEHTVVV